MPDIPATVSLTTIADASLATASPVRNNFTTLQTAANAARACLAGGTVNQLLAAVDSDTVQWIGGYTPNTPAISFSGGGGSIGSGTITGNYVQLGKLVHFYGTLTLSSTTWGTGYLKIALPVTAAGTTRAAGTATLLDNSSSVQHYTGIELETTSTLAPVVMTAYLSGAASFLTSTVPWTWADNDVVAWNVTYKAA